MEEELLHPWVEARRKRKRLKKLTGLPSDASVVKETRKIPGKGNPYQHTRTGYRPDLDSVMRSNWEANFARVLTVHGIKWDFEPRLFSFPIKRGTKAYMPDFYLTETDEWVEVKGWMDDKSRIKIKRFKKYYPDDFAKLTMVLGKGSKKSLQICQELEVPTIVFYQDLSKAYKSSIDNWEGS